MTDLGEPVNPNALGEALGRHFASAARASFESDYGVGAALAAARSCKFCGDPLPEGAQPGSACGREPRLLRRLALDAVGRTCLMWSALGYPTTASRSLPG